MRKPREDAPPPPSRAAALHPLRALWLTLAVAALLALFWWMSVSATTRKSNTFDEIAHLTAGYAYWVYDDYRLNPENGNLPQRLGALALLWNDVHFPQTSEAWKDSAIWKMGHAFFFESGNDPAQMLLASRSLMALLGVAAGLLVFLWSRALYGLAGAFLSLTLFILCPNFLAHSPLVTSDVAASLFFLAAVGTFWRAFHHVTILRILLCGLAMGALALAKFSAPLIVPIVAVLLVIRLLQRDALPLTLRNKATAITRLWKKGATLLAAVAAAAMIAVCVIWAGYGFRYSSYGPDTPAGNLTPGWQWVEQAQEKEPGLVMHAVLLARDHKFLPESYLYGFSFSYLRSQTRDAFLNGEYSITGWKRFFPLAFAMKTPMGTMGILLLAAGAATWRTWPRRHSPEVRAALRKGLYHTSPLWVLILVYGLTSILTPLNIGHRHILPLYPPLLILAGAALVKSSPRWATVVAASLVVILLAESIAIRPHYLAFFNQAAGGPREGYRHLVDSSLDWGQDLPGLADRLQSPASAPRVYLSYFGTGDPRCYGINAALLPGYFHSPPAYPLPQLKGGLYCVSASMLQGVYFKYARGPLWTPEFEAKYRALNDSVRQFEQANADAQARLIQERGPEFWSRIFIAWQQHRLSRLFAYLRTRRPDENVGYSILLYRLSDQEVQQAITPAEPGHVQ